MQNTVICIPIECPSTWMSAEFTLITPMKWLEEPNGIRTQWYVVWIVLEHSLISFYRWSVREVMPCEQNGFTDANDFFQSKTTVLLMHMRQHLPYWFQWCIIRQIAILLNIRLQSKIIKILKTQNFLKWKMKWMRSEPTYQFSIIIHGPFVHNINDVFSKRVSRL